MNFNFVDVILVLIVLLNAWAGWHRGFIWGLLDLVRWIVSFLGALFFYQYAANALTAVTGWSDVWTQPLAFILLIILLSLAVQMIGRSLLGRLSKDVHEHTANNFLGILPGLANGIIMAAILSALLFALPFFDGLQESLRQSPLANRLAAYTDTVETALRPIFEEPLQTLNRRTTITPGSNEYVELPFKVENFHPRPDLEARMLEMLNEERTSQGLPPLEADPEMREVARKHSADMFTRGYFSHYTPEKKSPFDRMREGNVNFRTAGENLALAPTLEIAHSGLMNSPGHRANILRPQFGRVGIGILDAGRRGLMVTQKFRN